LGAKLSHSREPVSCVTAKDVAEYIDELPEHLAEMKLLRLS
jgi:hypothetical protein